jgi:PAS domain S-box-containing protein
MGGLRKEIFRYLVGVLAAIAALFFRELLGPLLGSQNPYHTLWVAVVFCAWYCGVGPSIVTIVMGSLGVWYWFLHPYHSFTGKGHTEIFGMLGFLAFSAVIVIWGESTRRIMLERRQAEDELKKTHEELEDRVRERTAALLEKTSETAEKARLLDLVNDAIFVKTAKGTISYWNEGAERLYGWSKSEARGRIPGELLKTEFSTPLEEIEKQESWEGELRQSTRDGQRIVVASRWTALRDEQGNRAGWLEINTDITARKRAEMATRRLSGRLLTMQDEERRRIARGLHDSIGQYMTALKMNLDLMATTNQKQANVAAECSEILDKCLTETRTISYLLHPPLLDEAGLGSAARWYVEGFAERSSIKVNLDLPADLGRLPKDIEIALFRTMQEALTNVHRHSGGSMVDIRVSVVPERVRLEIEDDGKGIPDLRLRRLLEGGAETGVGIAGMRERVRELGGTLEIESDTTGTLVRVTIPLPQSAEAPIGKEQETEPRRVSAA